MDKIFIRGLKVETIIGVYDWERHANRPLSFDLDLGADFTDAAASDHVRDAIDYAAIMETITKIATEYHPALLEALAVDFAAHGYDLKHLLRTVMASRTYQLSSVPNATNLGDTRQFSRSYRRRLPAEVLVDAVTDTTGVPEIFSAVPPGGRAMQTWSYKIASHFLDAFGRPNSSSDCPCERDAQLSVVQSLHLMNSKVLQSKLADPKGRVRQLAASDRSEADALVV